MSETRETPPFTYRYDGGFEPMWSVWSNVDSYVALGESLGDALALAIDGSRLGFTEARPTETDLRLARRTW